MEFTVEFYVNASGHSPVQEFLLDLKTSDPGDFAAVVAGLEKLRYRQFHREPLTKALNQDLFELRHVGKLNTRVLRFFVKGRRIVAVHGIRTKAGPFLLEIWIRRGIGCAIGKLGTSHEQEQNEL
jgi:hypothetical protein